MMKKGVLLCVVGLLVYVQPVPTNSETVWLKDVTSRIQTDKRTFSDLDLPDVLTFSLSRGSHALNLNLKRNHAIDPNADIYVVQKLKDGRFHSARTQNLKKQDVAYYQDVENGAFMTVRCVRKSKSQCDRVINGNIRIEGRNYDLRPAETDVTSRNVLDNPNLLGKQYVLDDQERVQRNISAENKDAANAIKKNVEQELTEHIRRLTHGQEKQSHFARQDASLSSQNVAGLHNKGTKDKVRNLKTYYYVEMAILIDSGIWSLHSSLVQIPDEEEKEVQVKINIREAFCHVINGVNLRYKEVEDGTMSISVTLREFFFFKRELDFPHKHSLVLRDEGKTYIDTNDYLRDIFEWDQEYSEFLVEFDHAMLFTRHDLFDGELSNNSVRGLAYTGGVCDLGRRTSVVQINDYFETVHSAAHELGHSLGADHDGEKQGINCPAEDLYIMSPSLPQFDKAKAYSRNPWLFSNCSIESFQRTLRHKRCLLNYGAFYDNEEWVKNVMKLPGEVYTPDLQCKLIRGRNSAFCGDVSEDICRFMKCMNPRTGNCIPRPFSAAEGTICGQNKWCKKGLCVSKTSK